MNHSCFSFCLFLYFCVPNIILYYGYAIYLYLSTIGIIGQPGQKSGEEQEGFYLLKKDSQRRMTLTRVLNQDEAKICEVWMRGIHTEGQTVLQMVFIQL